MKNIVFLLLLSALCRAQDSLVLLNNNVIIATVQEVNVNSVKYNKYENPEGPLYIVLKTEIKYIRYKSGDIDRFEGTVISPEVSGKAAETTGASVNELNMYQKGCRDARLFYNHNGGSTCIGLTGCAIGLFGIIPAAIVAYTPPDEKNLDYPNKLDWNNAEYKKGYIYTAQKIKRKKVWTGYGIGLAASVITVLAIRTM